MPTPTNAPVLTWTASNDDGTGGSGVVGYHVYRDGQLIATPSSPTYADSGLSVSGSHAYWITAIDAVGNESPASATKVVAIDLDPPQAPPDLSVPSPTQRPTLTWGAATDVGPGPSAIDHYNVYRDGTLIGRPTTTTYADTRVSASGQATYTVRAVDLAGNVGPPSNPVSVTIDMTGPSLQGLSIPRERTVGSEVAFSVTAVDPQGSAVADPLWNFGDGSAHGSAVTHVYAAPGTYSVTVSAADALGNTTTSSPTTITIVAKIARVVAKASISSPATLRLKALRTRSWRVQATVKLDAGANVTVRLMAGQKTIGRTTRNVPDGSTAIALEGPEALPAAGHLHADAASRRRARPRARRPSR